MSTKLEQIILICPNNNCRTPFAATYLKMFIHYPEDFESIFDLVENKFNVNECPVCKTKFYAAADLGIVYREKKKSLVQTKVDEDKEKIKKTLGESYDIIFTKDILETRRLMIKWMNTSPEEIRVEIEKQKNKRIKIVTDRMGLRLMLSGLNGYVTLTMTDSEGNAIDLKQYYLESLNMVLKSTLEDCLLDKNILKFKDLIGERIFPECIIPELLDVLQDETEQMKSPENYDELTHKYLAEYMYTVASLHSGIPNQRKNHFTHCVYYFWTIHEKTPLKNFEHQYLLDRNLGQEFLSLEYLFDMGFSFEPLYSDHSKNHLFLWKIMDYYGWLDEFNIAVMDRLSVRNVTPESIDTAVEQKFLRLKKLILFNNGEQTHDAINTYVENEVIAAFSMKLPEVAQRFIIRLLSESESNWDKTAYIDICVQAIKGFNKYHDFDFSQHLLDLISASYADELNGQISNALYFDFLIEAGNTARYKGNYEDALEIYLKAEDLTIAEDVHPTEELRLQAAAVLKRNIAIVYRDLGQVVESEKHFVELMESDPHNFGITLNLVLLYFKMNEYEKILLYLEPFNGSLDIPEADKVTSLIMQGISHARLNDYTTGMSLVQKALNKKKFLSETKTAELLNGALVVCSAIENDETTGIEKAAKELFATSVERGKTHIIYSSLAMSMLRRYLLTGKKKEAENLIKIAGWEDGSIRGNWQYEFYLCWFYFEADNYPLAAIYAKHLFMSIEEAIPGYADSKFAISWMYDKEELQFHMQKIMYRLFKVGLVTEKDLLSMIEFSYGKELSIRIRPDQPQQGVEELLNTITSRYSNTVIIGFFEADIEVYFFSINTKNGQIVISEEPVLNLKEVRMINKYTSEAFRDACPGMLEETDKKLSPFRNLLQKLSVNFQALINKRTERIVFIPGKELANLPLHLMPHGASSLAEHFPIVYVTNLAILASLAIPTVEIKKTLLVSVNRRDEEAIAIDRCRQAGVHISKLFRSKGAVVHNLRETGATVDKVTQELAGAGEVIFLCHGASGGDKDGKGICLSYKGMLPPSLLPVKEVPQLKNFLLTWRDIESIENAPSVMVSIACSSAATVVGKGGINIGFEQSLFVKGTSAIISPLWDVEQESALYWIKQFFESRLNEGYSIEKAWQQAAIKTKASFPHEFFWAPFILKGTKN